MVNMVLLKNIAYGWYGSTQKYFLYHDLPFIWKGFLEFIDLIEPLTNSDNMDA